MLSLTYSYIHTLKTNTPRTYRHTQQTDTYIYTHKITLCTYLENANTHIRQVQTHTNNTYKHKHAHTVPKTKESSAIHKLSLNMQTHYHPKTTHGHTPIFTYQLQVCFIFIFFLPHPLSFFC